MSREDLQREATAYLTSPREGDTRTEAGHQWRWTIESTRADCGHPYPPHWRSTGKTLVMVFPPRSGQAGLYWCLFACDERGRQLTHTHHHTWGENAERDTFQRAAELASEGLAPVQ